MHDFMNCRPEKRHLIDQYIGRVFIYSRWYRILSLITRYYKRMVNSACHHLQKMTLIGRQWDRLLCM